MIRNLSCDYPFFICMPKFAQGMLLCYIHRCQSNDSLAILIINIPSLTFPFTNFFFFFKLIQPYESLQKGFSRTYTQIRLKQNSISKLKKKKVLAKIFAGHMHTFYPKYFFNKEHYHESSLLTPWKSMCYQL